MLSKKRQTHYIQKRIKNIFYQLIVFCTQQDPEAIHQLRVEFKKLKALSLFLNDDKPLRKSKLPNEFYQEAGKIRKEQIALLNIEKQEITSDTLQKNQLHVIESLSNSFIENQAYFLKSLEKTERKIIRKTVDIKNKEINSFFKKSIKKLNIIFKEGCTAEELHKGRKIVKALIYIYNMLPKKIQSQLNISTDYLKEIENEIGDWNDLLDAVTIAKTVHEENHSMIKSIQGKIQQSLFNIYLLTFDFKEKVYLK